MATKTPEHQPVEPAPGAAQALFRVVVCLLLVVGACLAPLFAQPRRVALSVGEAEVLAVRGQVSRRGPPAAATTGQAALQAGSVLRVGDELHAGPDGYALLGLADGSTIELQPDTQLEILDFSGGVRQLFRIWLGKVRLRVRKLVGAPNPYEMHTPVATIGVRGTEFDIEVLPNSVTRVRVYEGLVAVRNTQVTAGEVLVPAGKEVTVYPLRPPEPPITFEQVVAENFSRETPAEQPLLHRFLAFPDPHLDLVENPAYVSMVHRPAGRYYLYPSRSEAFSSPEISPLNPLNRFTDLRELFATDERLLRGVSSRISYLYPLDGWVVGGLYEFRGFDHDFRFRISRRIPTVFGGEVSVEQIGNSLFAPDLQSDSRSHRMVVLGARRLPGKTLAVSYDWTHSSGDIDTRYEFRPAGTLLYSDVARTLFSSDRRQVTFGYHLESDGLGSLGAFYRVGVMNGETGQDWHQLNGLPADQAAFNSEGFQHEVGGRWRVRLHRNLHLALLGSLNRTRFEEEVRDFRTSDSRRETIFWTPTAAAGLGYSWDDRLFGALDYQYSQVRSTGYRTDLVEQSLVGTERVRRRHHGLHGWLQYHLPYGFFAGAGGTWFRATETFDGRYAPDSTGWLTDFQGRLVSEQVLEANRLQLNQLGLSLGKRFETLFLEYQLSQTRGPRFSPLGHSFLLRFAF
jgi:hypothetical protein